MEDFERAAKGLIAKADGLIIKDDKGKIVWRLDELENLLQKDAPDTVNPSLWRHEKLNTIAGLFEIAAGVYQIRGFDLANLTLIKSQNGYIAVDPLGCIETAKAAIEFAAKSLGGIKITAIVVTHSHWDHFGGLGALAAQEDIEADKIKLVVPDRFTQELVSENIFVGAAMNRRSVYQFGNSLPTNAEGFIGGGLGKGASTGVSAPLKPNIIVKNKIEELTIDGEVWSIRLSNSVLSAQKGAGKGGASYILSRNELNAIALNFEAAEYPLFNEILSLLDRPAPNDFNIAEP